VTLSIMRGSATRIVGQTNITLGTPGPRGRSAQEVVFDAEIIQDNTPEAFVEKLQEPAVAGAAAAQATADAAAARADASKAAADIATTSANTATDTANAAAANANSKAAGAQAVVDAGANILAANVQTTLNAGVVRALVSQPDYSQKSTIKALIPSAMAPVGAAELILDGHGRSIQGTHASGRAVFKRFDPSGAQDTLTVPAGLNPLAANLILDGRGRPVHAVNSVGDSLLQKAAASPKNYIAVPAGIVPQGSDPVPTVNGRGLSIKALTTAPAVTLVPLPPALAAAGAVADGHGQLMPGSVDPRSGTVIGLHSPAHGMAYLTGTSPNRQVRAWLPGDRDILISMPGSDPDMFYQDGDVVHYRRTAGGIAGDGRYMEVESLAPEPVPMSTSRFAYVPLIGQSNSCGYGLDVTNVITAPVRPGRARMFARGPRLQSDAVVVGTGLPLDPNAILTLRDLYEVPEVSFPYIDTANGAPSGAFPKETPCSGMGWQLTSVSGLPSTDMLITATLGVGSITLANMSKGKRPYFNTMRSIWSAAVKAAVRGVAYIVPYIVIIQGESDVNATLAARTAGLVQLQSDYDTDIKAMIGQTQNVVLVGAQISSWTVSNLARSEVPNAILNLAIAQPDKFMCSGAMYGFPFNMPNHLFSVGHDDHGEQIGYIIDRRLAGVTQPQVYCTGTTVDAATKTVRLHMNVQGAITIDTSVVSDPGNFGVTFAQDAGAGETISGTVTVSGADIIVPFSAIPTGSNRRIELGMIGIPNNWGGPTSGPRTCFQDSVTYAKRDGRPGISRACHQTIYF
jgi:hypothetical protein